MLALVRYPSECSTFARSTASSPVSRSGFDRQLHASGVVDTWHDTHDRSDLIACCPTDYCYVDKPCPCTGASITNLRTNHSGVALFHRSQYSAREVGLPDYQSFEHTSVFLQCPTFSALTMALTV